MSIIIDIRIKIDININNYLFILLIIMETKDSIYFYGQKKEFGYFSNFYNCEFTENEIIFNCSEQYFMYYKLLTFDKNNIKLANNILNEKDPKKIKRYGRMVKNYDDKIWNEIRFNIMIDALRLKFNQNEYLKEKLLTTENKTLYEAAKNDKIWGIGMSVEKALSIDKNKYGRNLLGRGLMIIREELRE